MQVSSSHLLEPNHIDLDLGHDDGLASPPAQGPAEGHQPQWFQLEIRPEILPACNTSRDTSRGCKHLPSLVPTGQRGKYIYIYIWTFPIF
jgi:hypothetical protein